MDTVDLEIYLITQLFEAEQRYNYLLTNLKNTDIIFCKSADFEMAKIYKAKINSLRERIRKLHENRN